MNRSIIVIALLLMASLSHASILTFDGLSKRDTPSELVSGDISVRGEDFVQFSKGQGALSTVKIMGFDIITVAGRLSGPTDYLYRDESPKAYNGTDTFTSWTPLVWTDDPFATMTTIRRQNGELFDFYSIDFGMDAGAYPNASFLITGVFENGEEIQRSIVLDDIHNQHDIDGNDFEHFTFEGFTNIKSLKFARSNYEDNHIGIVFDNLETSAELTNNIATNTAIPEPITLSLFSLGLGIVAIRKKNIFS